MKNIKLKIEYEGTNYSGWQIQENAVSIQQIIEDALFKVTGTKTKISGSGRTDAGVHAFSQIANFRTESSVPPEKFSYAINRYIPDDIVIKKSEQADDDFHARFSAKGKEYIYKAYCSEFPSALYRNLAYHIKGKVNVESMNAACSYLKGIHDFKSFMASGSEVLTTEREIYSASCIKEDSMITFKFRGSGFLYNMVRIIVGTLLDVGYGNIKQESMEEIIKAKNRECAGKTAPAHGLYLNEVIY